MAFDISGKLHKVFTVEEKSGSFRTRDIVLEVQDGNYMQYVKFQLTQDRCSIVDNFREGDEVRVHFNLRGREWQGKYFTNLDAWRIEASTNVASGTMNQSSSDPFGESVYPEANGEPVNRQNSTFDDDLPF